MVTLKDVAKRANVSKMTVSRVINHPELVTDELKELVFKAMDELGYRPNTAAKALAKNRTMVVKVLILEEIDSTEPYFMYLINGIAKQLDVYHYALQLVTENTYNLGGCDGYIITGMTRNDYEWVEDIKEPVIVFGENDIPISFVDTNNEQAMKTVTQYAVERGYDSFVYIGIDVPELFAQKRLKGFINVLTENPQLTYEIYQVTNSSSEAQALVNKIKISENTCFICATDRIALGIQRGLKSQDTVCNYGITGFDGVFLDQIANPKMTTMKQEVELMGKHCVELLMKKIEGESVPIENYMQAHLQIRETLQ